MNVLEEPTAFEEVEKRYQATFPSMTVCGKNNGTDTFQTFGDVIKSIERFRRRMDVWVYFRTKNETSREVIKARLKFENNLTDIFNTTYTHVWEWSAIVQPDFLEAIVPCVTVNIPSIGPVTQGTAFVSKKVTLTTKIKLIISYSGAAWYKEFLFRITKWNVLLVKARERPIFTHF